MPHTQLHFTVALKHFLSKATKHVRATMENGADPSRDVVRLFVKPKSSNDVINI